MNKYIIFALSLLLVPVFAHAGTVSIGTIMPNSEVQATTNITFQVNTDGFSNTPKYVLSDSFPGSTLSNSNINAWGSFNWTPNHLDIGSHAVTIIATDSYGNKASVIQNLIIKAASPVTLQNLSASTVNPENAVTFNVSAQGYVNPSYSIIDSFPNTSLRGSNLTTGGNFSWTPTKSDIGVHSLAIRVTTPIGRNETIFQTITVNGLALTNVSGTRITVGQPLTFIASTYGMSASSYSISDTARNNTIDATNINGSNFTWTPKEQDIGSHTITVSGTDYNGNVVSNQLNITVVSNVVTPPAPTPSAPVVTTPVTSSYTFKLNLQLGSLGKEVIELQKKLLAEGYFSGPTNGSFGPLTKAAVIKYQKAKGISAIGSVGPATRAALNKK